MLRALLSNKKVPVTALSCVYRSYCAPGIYPPGNQWLNKPVSLHPQVPDQPLEVLGKVDWDKDDMKRVEKTLITFAEERPDIAKSMHEVAVEYANHFVPNKDKWIDLDSWGGWKKEDVNDKGKTISFISFILIKFFSSPFISRSVASYWI